MSDVAKRLEPQPDLGRAHVSRRALESTETAVHIG